MMMPKIEKIEPTICSNCGNVYIVTHIKEGEDWNDFGFRYCPFCGMERDDYNPDRAHTNIIPFRMPKVNPYE